MRILLMNVAVLSGFLPHQHGTQARQGKGELVKAGGLCTCPMAAALRMVRGRKHHSGPAVQNENPLTIRERPIKDDKSRYTLS